MPYPRRVDHGQAGRDFETRILQVANTYWKVQYAWIQKAYTKMTKINGAYIYSEELGYDFYGSIIKGHSPPLPVYFEAKTTAENYLPLLRPDQKGDGLKYHQLMTLETLQRLGNQTFILWEIRGKIVVKLSPYSLYLRYKRGDKSVKILEEDRDKLYTVVDTKQRIDYLNLLT